MSMVFPCAESAVTYVPTSRSLPTASGTVSQQRAPTDPFYYADVEVQNIVIGSSWMLGYYDAGDFTELDSGTAAATSFTISSVPSYGSPFLLELRVRKSSAQPKYKRVNQFAFHNAQGIVMYISQVLDEVAT